MGVLDLDALDAGLREDPDDTLTLVVQMASATDERLRAAVRRLAPRLILDQTRRGRPRQRGVARRRPISATRGGELDLDASMDAVVGARAEARMPSLEELRATDWARPDLALCLVIDRSGSMNGARLTTAAVTGAACLSRAPQEHAVLTFAARTDVLKALGQHRRDTATVEQILGLRGHGTTGLSEALAAGKRQLDGARSRRRVLVLLSDCRVTDDVDALPAARAVASSGELVILAPADDSEAAVQLGRAAGARVGEIASVLDVPAALARLLGDDRV